jgi:hypothetical protein
VAGKLVDAIPCFDIPDVDLRIWSIASSKEARAIRTKRAIHLARLNRKLERVVSAGGPRDIADVERRLQPTDLVA